MDVQSVWEQLLQAYGAMGTEIYRHHVFTNRCFDELCISDPKLIRQIHADYRDTGADVLTTDTFGANRVSLAKCALAERLAEILRAGAKLAREAADRADRPIYVAGSIGPTPALLPQRATIEELIFEQAESLMVGGADFILFETQPNREALERATAGMRRLPGVPFVLSFAITSTGETISGESVERMLAPLPSGLPQPAAWGVNCGVGPDGILGAVEQAMKLTSLPLVVQPNAGMPKEVENRRIYLCSPEYLVHYRRSAQVG